MVTQYSIVRKCRHVTGRNIFELLSAPTYAVKRQGVVPSCSSLHWPTSFKAKRHMYTSSLAYSLLPTPSALLCSKGMPVYPTQRHSSLTSPRSSQRALHATSALKAASKNPYEVLGVKSDASAAEIKKTYFSVSSHLAHSTTPYLSP